MKVQEIKIASIIRGDNKREVSEVTVAEMAKSIRSCGLLQPILVRRAAAAEDGTERFTLVSGHHRLRAFDQLRWKKIAASVINAPDLKAELAAIDENLMRKELSPAESALALRRRKEVYEELHPGTRANVAGALAKHGKASEKPSFAASVAVATGQSERTARRHIAEAKNIPVDELRQIQGTAIDDQQWLRELNALPSEQRTPYLQAAIRGEPVVLPSAAQAPEADTAVQERKAAQGNKVSRKPAATGAAAALRAIVVHAKAFLEAPAAHGGMDPGARTNALSMLEKGGWQVAEILAQVGEALARALAAGPVEDRREHGPDAGQERREAA